MESNDVARTTPTGTTGPVALDRETTGAFGSTLVVVGVAAAVLGAGAAVVAERARWAADAQELGTLGTGEGAVSFAEVVHQGVIAAAALEAVAAVLAGVLLGLRVPGRARAVGLAVTGVVGWTGLAWLFGGAGLVAGAGLGVAWPGATGAYPSAAPAAAVALGPAALAACATLGVLVAGRRGTTAARGPCSRVAALVVVGLVLVGTALSAALLAWSSEVAWDGPGWALHGGALPVVPVVVLLAWLASGRHRAVPAVATVAVVALVVEAMVLPTGSGVVAYYSGEWSALAMVMAAGLTALVTTGLAAHRDAASEALGGLVA